MCREIRNSYLLTYSSRYCPSESNNFVLKMCLLPGSIIEQTFQTRRDDEKLRPQGQSLQQLPTVAITLNQG